MPTRVRHRLPRRASRLATAAVGALALLATTTGAPARATPSVSDARDAADRLRTAVAGLEVAAEQATEAYDGAQERLGIAVQRSMAAEERLQAAEQRSSSALDAAALRVRALYESGGSLGLYATALDGTSITDVLDRMQLAGNVIADSQTKLAATDAAVSELAGLRTRLAALATDRNRLQVAAAAKAAHVRDLLAREQALLAAADQRVRDAVAAQQAADAAAAAQAFAARLAAAQQQAALSGLPSGAATAPNPVAAAAIAAARTRLGTPYVWGATGPDAFDCSGLTGWAYAQAGLHLPRTAAEQWYAGPHPALADLAPGDLLFWATDPADPATIHHVALYIGGGQMIAAPHTGTVVQVQAVYLTGFIGAVRPTG